MDSGADGKRLALKRRKRKSLTGNDPSRHPQSAMIVQREGMAEENRHVTV